MSHGVEILHEGGALFRLWAPSAKQVALELNDAPPQPMQRSEEGWYTLKEASAVPGMRYFFLIDETLRIPDPASRCQPEGVTGPSVIAAPLRRDDWKGRPWEETVIYELHVGTFSEAGTYDGVIARLPHLAELGITAIELMPIASFEGERGWGYDGVLPFAPHAPYGDMEALQRLIALAHEHGLMVFLDVVYNHFGPAGNYWHRLAERFFTASASTPWGAAIDFTQKPVREFFVQNACYWIEEVGFDGLRFDAVHAIIDPSTLPILTELAQTVKERLPEGRHVHLMLENEHNEAHRLERDFTAQWNDDAHHALHVLLTQESFGYYEPYAASPIEQLGRCLAQGFAYQGELYMGKRRGEASQHLPLPSFIAFLQNHDHIGNRAQGERLSVLVSPEKYQLGLSILLLSPQTPMLFMGEEWGARTPFLYFCAFTGELEKQVREGRQKEFAHFPAFADAEAQHAIPDPNALSTFTGSRLHWGDLDEEGAKTRLAFVQRLLRLRREHLTPLLAEPLARRLFDRIGDRGLEVHWQWENGAVLRLLANFSDAPLGHGKHVTGTILYGDAGATLSPWQCCVALIPPSTLTDKAP